MLPGLGGGVGGTQLSSTTPLTTPNVAPAINTSSIPAPQMVNNLNTVIGGPNATPTSGTDTMDTKIGGSNPTPQSQAPLLSASGGAILPQGVMPQPTVSQALATPQVNNNLAALYGTSAIPADTSNGLADKMNALHETVKGSVSPQSNPMRTQDTQAKLDATSKTPDSNPMAEHMDAYASMNPVVKTMYDNITNLLSSQNTRTSLVDEFTKLNTDQGIQADKLALMNLNNIMKGTEDDIRNEITKAGGFATNSQVQALTSARNKVLMTQASALQDTLNAKEDYVKQIMDLTKADYAEADKQVSEQMGLDEKVADMQINMDNAARSNYQSIVSQIGYDGLAKAFQGNPTGMAQAESILGLPKGALLNPAFLATTNSKNDFTLSPGSRRFDAQGKLIASVPATGTGAGGGGGGSSDPYVQSWVSNILNGNSTMQQVPAALRNEVSLQMANAPAAMYSPLASSRFTMAANRIVSNFIKLPQYELTANGLPYLQRIDAAMKTPGSVSDQDLLDSLTKLNTSGNAITDAQVKLITGGKSFSDMASVFSNKFQNGGVLSDNQRQQIDQIAKAIYANYSKGYQPVYDQAVSQLQAAGIPKAFWTIPDLNNLSGYSQYTQQTGQQEDVPGLSTPSASVGSPQFPNSLMMTDFKSLNGVMMAKGTDGNYHPF